jgi:transposase-like protein
MVDEQAMKAALAAIDAQGVANYRQIAKDYDLIHTTVMRRWKGQTRSRADFQSEVNQNLTNEQERLLVKQINNLTARSIPPTSQMVKNFAEEMIRRAMGKNWVSDFCRRH